MSLWMEMRAGEGEVEREREGGGREREGGGKTWMRHGRIEKWMDGVCGFLCV